MQTDFEQLEGWMPTHPSLTMEQARSGRYSIMASPDMEYSLTYKSSLSNLMAKVPKKIRLSAWAYMKKASGAALVCEIRNPNQENKIVFYDKIILAEQVRKGNEWVEVVTDFAIPNEIESRCDIKIYLWIGNSAFPVYIDDLTLYAVR